MSGSATTTIYWSRETISIAKDRSTSVPVRRSAALTSRGGAQLACTASLLVGGSRPVSWRTHHAVSDGWQWSQANSSSGAGTKLAIEPSASHPADAHGGHTNPYNQRSRWGAAGLH